MNRLSRGRFLKLKVTLRQFSTKASENQIIEEGLNGTEVVNGESFIEVLCKLARPELLSNAKVPIWGSNRPSVLIWMVLQDSSGRC